MPLVFGIPTFDRSGACPDSPWADLCSLLSDCVYENVLLVVDDRMQLLEEISLFIDTHRNAVSPLAIQKMSTLVSAMQNLPHSRILVNAHPTDDSECTAADLADRVIACVGHTLDFEYAFPRSQTQTIRDVLLEADSDLKAVDPLMSPLTTAEHGSPLDPPVLKSSSSTRACGTPCRSQAFAGPEEGHSPASHPPAATHQLTDVANSFTDSSQTLAGDGKQPVEHIHTDRNQPEGAPLLTATALQGPPTQAPAQESTSDLVAKLPEPSHSRTDEHIPLGDYQASRAVDLARNNRAKTSFGTKHDVPALSGTLGRAFRFTNEIIILDGVLGTILTLVKPGRAIQHQDNNVQRFIYSYELYALIAKAANPAMRNPLLRLRTYYKPRKHGSSQNTPGPSRSEVSHFERLVADNAGLRVECEVREWVGRGQSAHDRYLVIPHCCVELPGGSDSAYAIQLRDRRDGKVKKISRHTSAEKHFRFVSIVTPSSSTLPSQISDVARDLQRYEQGPIYVHPSDLSPPTAQAHRP